MPESAADRQAQAHDDLDRLAAAMREAMLGVDGFGRPTELPPWDEQSDSVHDYWKRGARRLSESGVIRLAPVERDPAPLRGQLTVADALSHE